MFLTYHHSTKIFKPKNWYKIYDSYMHTYIFLTTLLHKHKNELQHRTYMRTSLIILSDLRSNETDLQTLIK